MSLDGADRHMLVRQTAETWLGKRGKPHRPRARRRRGRCGSRRSAPGSTSTATGTPSRTPRSGLPSILTWDHVAPMGRDQFVRVVYPGYLYPLRAPGRARQADRAEDEGRLAVGRRSLPAQVPRRRRADAALRRQHDFPFHEVRLGSARHADAVDGPRRRARTSFFWPFVGGQPFKFVLHCLDHEGRPVRLVAPLIWVAEHFQALRRRSSSGYRSTTCRRPASCPADGQKIAFAPVAQGRRHRARDLELQLDGTAALGNVDAAAGAGQGAASGRRAPVAARSDQTIAYDAGLPRPRLRRHRPTRVRCGPRSSVPLPS